jgi:hypothetical protein
MASNQARRTAVAVAVAAALVQIVVTEAGAGPVDKKSFLGWPATYLTFELTHTGTRAFGAGTAKDALHDGAWRFTRSVKFEVPLTMAVPGTFPLSGGQPSLDEMGEQDRFIGWMASPPDSDPATEAMLAGGKMDLSKSAMFLPATYSVDDTHQSRYRDRPEDGFATQTTLSRGTGTVYAVLSGMLMCDLKKLVCDVVNVSGGYNSFTDMLTVTTTSDVPGFVPTTERRAPDLMLPGISQALQKQLSGMSISLQDPFMKTFTAPAPDATGGPAADGSTVTLKLTLSSKPAPKAGAAAKK